MGTVTCRYCYGRGHNVKGCETLQADIVREGKYGYAYRRYGHKYYNPDGTKLGKQANKCSYCKEEGHTKRTCNLRLEDLAHNINENKHYRRNVVRYFNDKGIGIGALMKIYDRMYLVTDIYLNGVSCGLGSDRVIVLNNVEDGRQTYTNVDSYFFRYPNYHEILSPGAPLEADPEWLEGRDERYQDVTKKTRSLFRDLDWTPRDA